MTSLDAYKEIGKELENRLRLRTYPIGIKLLKEDSQIPQEAIRPMKDIGSRLATCQAFSMSRREGDTVAMMLRDMWCPESVIGFGLAEPPDFYFQGRHRFPQSTESLDAGKAWAEEFPRLQVGEISGILSAPMHSTTFEPDVFILYCDIHQLGTLLLAAACKSGHELTCTVGAKGGCVYSVVCAFQKQDYQVTVPCPGDRRFAMAEHDEIIFSLPAAKLKELMTSLTYLDKYAYRLPLRCIMHPQPELPANYVELGKLMNMSWMEGDELSKYIHKK